MLKVLPLIGIYIKNICEDRVILEKIIFPHFINKHDCQKVIFIGVGWYTMEYNKLFNKKEFWTIDIEPKFKIYGSKRHIIDSMENMDSYFKKNSIDLIICNGVFSYAVKDSKILERTLKVCYDLIRKGGVFLIGWNDLPEYKSISFETCENIKLFKPFVFEPFGAQRKLANPNNCHTYSFYTK